MKTSTVAILVLAGGLAIAMVLMAMFSMGQLAESASGERTKLALALQTRFKFSNVTTDTTSRDLFFELYLQMPGDPPPEDLTRERTARKHYTEGRRLRDLFKDAESQKQFDELANYPETDAYADWQMWDVACAAIHDYDAPDRNTVETIKITRKVTYGIGPTAETRERTMEPMKVPKKVEKAPERREIKR